MKKRIVINIIVLIFLIAVGVFTYTKDNKKPRNSESRIFIVQAENLSTPLYFKGIIEPIHSKNIISPAQGVILENYLHYGELVRKDQPLAKIYSEELGKNYKDTLANYLKAKDSFATASNDYDSSRELWQAGIISDNNYKLKESNLNSAQLALLQANKSLSSLLTIYGEEHALDQLKQLDFSDTEKVKAAFEKEADTVTIKASMDGVILPADTAKDSKNGDEKKLIAIDAQVKQGDIIGVIADLSGLSVVIEVPEIYVNKIKLKQAVTITGLAFTEHVLHGNVESLPARAAKSEWSANIPQFLVRIVIPELTDAERKQIRVGMSAKVKLDVGEVNAITVPLAAVFEKEGKATVTRVTDQGSSTVTVVVGGTTADKVTITSGLQAGDKITY